MMQEPPGDVGVLLLISAVLCLLLAWALSAWL